LHICDEIYFLKFYGHNLHRKTAIIFQVNWSIIIITPPGDYIIRITTVGVKAISVTKYVQLIKTIGDAVISYLA
jgi:hypothetical protein